MTESLAITEMLTYKGKFKFNVIPQAEQSGAECCAKVVIVKLLNVS